MRTVMLAHPDHLVHQRIALSSLGPPSAPQQVGVRPYSLRSFSPLVIGAPRRRGDPDLVGAASSSARLCVPLRLCAIFCGLSSSLVTHHRSPHFGRRSRFHRDSPLRYTPLPGEFVTD